MLDDHLQQVVQPLHMRRSAVRTKHAHGAQRETLHGHERAVGRAKELEHRFCKKMPIVLRAHVDIGDKRLIEFSERHAR